MSAPEVSADPSMVASPKKTGVKKSAARGPKKPKASGAHPPYNEMIKEAIHKLKEHNGSSRQALIKYIMANYKVGNDKKMISTHIKLALKRGVAAGMLKLTKGSGAAGRFRIGSEPARVKKPAKAKRAKTSAPAKKPASAKPKAKKPATARAVKPKPKAKAAKPKKAPKAAAGAKPKKPKTVKAKKPKAAKPKKATVSKKT